MISLTVSGLGAIVAAIGSGVLLARCFRAPRGDIIAWSVALLGLFVSLGSQALGHLAGFDAAMFRAMEIGGQVIAPLALILALSETAARSGAVRFCARLYIPALGIVAIVILTMDQLAQVTFTKAWPDPAVVYQLPPNYVLMFAIGPLTTLITIIAVVTVVMRSGQPGWNAVLPAQLLGGAAALAVAYPCLAQLVTYLTGTHVPVSSEFSVLCTAAAALAWLAGVRTGRLPMAALQGRDSGGPYRDSGSFRDTGSFRDGGSERGSYPDDRRSYRDDDRSYRDDYRRGGNDSGNWPPRDDPDFATGDFVTGDFAAGDYARDSIGPGAIGRGDFGHGDGARSHQFADGDFATGDFVTGDLLDRERHPEDPAHGWQTRDGASEDAFDDLGDLGSEGRLYGGRHGDGRHGDDRHGDDRHGDAEPSDAGAGAAGEDQGRAQLFGQIEIYTLLEDRVDEFDQLADRLVEQVRSREPDSLVFIVHAVPSAPMQRILYEVYRDRLAYDRHTQQPYVRQFDADRRPFVLATNVIELGLQQAKVSPFPSVTDLFPEPGYDTSGFERPDYLRDYGRTPDQHGSARSDGARSDGTRSNGGRRRR
jgi:quinol monooxygenase YgiN